MKFILLLLLSFPVFSQSIIPNEFSASFEETLISSVSGKTIKSNGKISYKYPSHLRVEVLEPEPSTVVVSPKKTWIYQPPFIEGEKGQVTIEKKSSWPLLQTFDSLTKSLEGSKEFTHKFSGNKLVISFSKESVEKLGIKEVIFIAQGEAKKVKSFSAFDSMTLTKADGKEQSYKFSNIKVGPTKVSEYTFDIPKNTKVIQN
ncbi:MAG TPA: outer membrane lipoprotein carrier protein LolA [Bacteriovoracaceae bacterium]|nr:outer membrane lipoprotein carrier protein LolA [Bacteriovoracaceae bacterium]